MFEDWLDYEEWEVADEQVFEDVYCHFCGTEVKMPISGPGVWAGRCSTCLAWVWLDEGVVLEDVQALLDIFPELKDRTVDLKVLEEYIEVLEDAGSLVKVRDERFDDPEAIAAKYPDDIALGYVWFLRFDPPPPFDRLLARARE